MNPVNGKWYIPFQIATLKSRLVKMGLTIRYFRTPEDLGRLVQQDWSIVIDTLYPPLQDMGAALGFGKTK